MKVGVAVPVRNGLPWIETCLTSIRAQTWPTCAAYVYDDASDDGTSRFLADRPTWYRRIAYGTEPVGWPAALNIAAALAAADGCDAVMTMNADDWLRLDCIDRCVRALSTVDAVVPYTQQIGGENVVQASAAHVTLADFRHHTPLVAFGLIDTAVWCRLGGYHTDVNIPGMDAGYNEWDFWLRFYLAGFQHTVVTEPVVYYRMHPDQLHHVTTARHTEAVDAIHRKHPELRSPPND